MAQSTKRCDTILVNELLAFVQNKLDVMDELSLEQICLTSYVDKDIYAAKMYLRDTANPLHVKLTTRQKEGNGKKDLQDIFRVFKGDDPDDIPTYVARDLYKLPPVTSDHVDVTTLPKDIVLLKEFLKMFGQKRVNDSVHWYMSELSSRVVAESGNAWDRFHLGKLILRALKDAPDFVLQIDGATSETETCASVLKRSVICAEAMKSLGLKQGDIIVMMGPNHLNLSIPFYAALYVGIAVAPIDPFLRVREMEDLFVKDEPKIVFCQRDRTHDVRTALNNCKLDSKIVTFDGDADVTSDSIPFTQLLDKYDKDTNIDEFKASDFDGENTEAVLISTSGSTGLPKQSVVTHKNLAIAGPYFWIKENRFPTATKLCLVVSALHWCTAIVHFIFSAIMRYTRLQSSLPPDQEHMQELLKTYKPTDMILGPVLMTTLMKPGPRGQCDFSSFETILIGGGVVTSELLNALKKRAPNTEVFNAYGMSEICGYGFISEHVEGSSGRPAGHLQYRLVEVETGKDIVEPNVPGELWLKGPSVFKGYLKYPEANKDTFSEDGWLKTGDLFKRDEHWNFYFVDRIKMLLKYRSHHVSPAELQNLICQHPGIVDAAVAGIPDDENGDLPVAFVVKRQGHNVSEQEIKDLVKDNLTDSKQLRGGVIFIDSLPVNAAGKLDYKKIKQMVLEMKK